MPSSPAESGGSVLTFDSTVSRIAVHKDSVFQVFLTDARRAGADEVHLAAQVPVAHSYYNDHTMTPRRHDPLLIVELARQAAVYTLHTFFDVPLTQKFIFTTGELTVTDADALRAGHGPGQVEIAITLVERRYRGAAFTGAVMRVTFSFDGADAAVFFGATQWMSPAVWARLRSRSGAAAPLSPPRPGAPGWVDPARVGRTRRENVVLADLARQADDRGVVATVVADTRHAGMFDHALDHLPAVVIFEASRQAALVAAGGPLGSGPEELLVTACTQDFLRFGELDLATVCRAEVLSADPATGTARIGVRLEQGEEPIARAEVELTRIPARPAGERVPVGAAEGGE